MRNLAIGLVIVAALVGAAAAMRIHGLPKPRR